jgi:hypothetical protein
MEIIEIGAVAVEAATGKRISEYQAFIRPVRNPILTNFCLNLTSITHDQVDSADEYAKRGYLVVSYVGDDSMGVDLTVGAMEKSLRLTQAINVGTGTGSGLGTWDLGLGTCNSELLHKKISAFPL